ncbi:MAG: class I SAM-dependent methyltransferase [Candidatus Shapirobacteria bacterium]|nr:class I SAM-dependent methyltransferase [Candidatus Shapirobacteria bacterium]
MAFYDHYNYQRYWQGRKYEHKAEKIALEKLLKNIPDKNRKTILDIGAGFGRITPIYANQFASCYLIEPSEKLISQAKKNLKKYQNLTFQKRRAEELSSLKKADVAIMIRVAHHIKKLDPVFKKINHSLKRNGYLILEFANKVNFKTKLKMWFGGNFSFCQDQVPCDRRSLANINKKTIFFLNHHPQKINQELEQSGFKIITKLSVSNFRWPLLKKIIPTEILIWGEKILQPVLAKINFGPSIFILAQKTN